MSTQPKTTRVIHSPIYPGGRIDSNLGHAGFFKIAEVLALAVTPQCLEGGGLQLQTDAAGRDIAANQVTQAAEAVCQWISITGLLLTKAEGEISNTEWHAAAWAIVGLSELLSELQLACSNLSLPVMNTADVLQAVNAAHSNPEKRGGRHDDT